MQTTRLAQILFSVQDIYKKMVEPDKNITDGMPFKNFRKLPAGENKCDLFNDFDERTVYAKKQLDTIGK